LTISVPTVSVAVASSQIIRLCSITFPYARGATRKHAPSRSLQMSQRSELSLRLEIAELEEQLDEANKENRNLKARIEELEKAQEEE